MFQLILKFLQHLLDGLYYLCDFLLSILPSSPFSVDFDSIPYLSSLNWVIPFSSMYTITSYWVLAIAIWYISQIGLRWAKVVSS